MAELPFPRHLWWRAPAPIAPPASERCSKAFGTPSEWRAPAPIRQVARVRFELGTPPEIATEVILELLASLEADIWRMALVEADPENKAELMRVWDALWHKEHSFDPHDAAETAAARQDVDAFARRFNAAVDELP